MPGYNPQYGYDQGPPPPGFPTQAPQPQFQYSTGYAIPQFPYSPQPNIICPSPQMSFPAFNMSPDGYTFLAPAATCRIHAIKTSSPPWQQHGFLPHSKLKVPVNTTVKELMQGLRCNNSDAKKNRLVEITEGGNGTWYRGMSITGDQKDKVKKTIADYCWDATRSGNPGERPVVWIWATRD